MHRTTFIEVDYVDIVGTPVSALSVVLYERHSVLIQLQVST